MEDSIEKQSASDNDTTKLVETKETEKAIIADDSSTNGAAGGESGTGRSETHLTASNGGESMGVKPKDDEKVIVEDDGDGDIAMEDAESSKAKTEQAAQSTAMEIDRPAQKSPVRTGAELGGKKLPSAGQGAPGGKKLPSTNGASKASVTPAPAQPALPVLRGTLSYNVEQRRHLIRGMWKFEGPQPLPPQRFELLRNLRPEEDPTELPKDGEFHGSFSLAYLHTTSKGKQKEKSRIVQENGVNIKFTKIEDDENGAYKVDGKGTNQFGVFHINGTATPNGHDEYSIELRKRYEAPPAPPPASSETSKKRKFGSVAEGGDADDGPLPEPSRTYEKNVVCLRGKLHKEESSASLVGPTGLGVGEVVHRIRGMWAPSLEILKGDPQLAQKSSNPFEYEHKSSTPSQNFPVSGRYSGWFDIFEPTAPGGKHRVNERDISLRFRKNNAGYYNVEGKGSNVYGKYTITGTLTDDNEITLFRHFQPRKIKAAKASQGDGRPAGALPVAKRPSIPSLPEPKLKIDDVQAPEDSEGGLDALKPPDHGTYSAVSRGILRVNEDGSHSCQGKWAVTREHFTNGQTSNFTFRLEAHFAEEASRHADGAAFPLDSAMYKGSFQLKKQGSRYQTIVDQQVVMKFRKNSTGAYNVYGKGENAIGIFNLTGTLILSGKAGGQVELYRLYPPELLAAPPVPKTTPTATAPKPKPETSKIASIPTGIAPVGKMPRRESSRLTKLPSRLEDDDPESQLSRIMERCSSLLRFIREKDVELGAFFSEPVDPVALGIPQYFQIIREPMDLRTIHRRMESDDIQDPEEFARLCRLVFENAMTFNVDPSHSVHIAARNLLIIFNQKWRDVDRLVQTYRRETNDVKKKGRRKKELKSPKQRRLDEVQEMTAANNSLMSSLMSAAPMNAPGTSVTRTEFNLLINLLQQLQRQLIMTHTAVAELSSDEIESSTPADSVQASFPAPAADLHTSAIMPPPTDLPPIPESVREPVVSEDSRPLTLKEQELLTETINELDPDHLPRVIQIIREAAKLTGDEDEIDLEIDQLDTVTQRKLLKYVSKFAKKPKGKPKGSKPKGRPGRKPGPKKKQPPAPAFVSNPAPSPSPSSSKPKSDPNSFFAIAGDDDSDSDSEGQVSESKDETKQDAGSEKDQFKLVDGLGAFQDDADEDDDDGLAAKWNISKADNSETKKDADEDGAWGAAREEALALKAREEDKKKREEKLKAEAEIAKQQRMAEAERKGEEIRAQRMEEEEKEARLREEQEKEAEEQRKAAREAARAEVEAVEQTVDLDEQRDIMKQYEQSFLDKDLGGASPSSDFGF